MNKGETKYINVNARTAVQFIFFKRKTLKHLFNIQQNWCLLCKSKVETHATKKSIKIQTTSKCEIIRCLQKQQ